MNGQPFYALIIPQSGPPSPPLGIWGGGGVGNYPDAGFPGPQPGQPPRPWGPINYPDQGLPGRPPQMWGPIFYPDQGLPGPQPGQPPRPWGPINYPDQGLPRPPLGLWGPIYYPDQGLPGNQPIAGWGPGFPTNPIVIPPGDLPTEPVGDDKMVIVVFIPGVGYKMVVVPKPEMPPGYAPPTGPSTERPTPVKG